MKTIISYAYVITTYINICLFRYHFEANKERFLPTITFSGGRVDISVLWPDAVEQLPSITDVRIHN